MDQSVGYVVMDLVLAWGSEISIAKPIDEIACRGLAWWLARYPHG